MRSLLTASLTICASMPLAAQTGSSALGPNLSHGFRYGMTPQQVATAAMLLPDVKKAQASSKGSSVRITYKGNTPNQLGFSFTYDFSFNNGGLIWVDLVGSQICNTDITAQIDNIESKLIQMYGKMSSVNSWRVGDTQVYILTADDLPEVPKRATQGYTSTGDALRMYDFQTKMADMQRQCGDVPAGHVILRFKGIVPAKDSIPSEADHEAVRIAIKAQTEKAKADRSAFDISK